MTTPIGGTMPPGGAPMGAVPPGVGQQDSNPGTNTPSTAMLNPSGGFTPPFQMGKGKAGVFTDPRQQIAGGVVIPAQAAATTPQSGATTAPSGGAASNIGGTGALTGGPAQSGAGNLNNLSLSAQEIQQLSNTMQSYNNGQYNPNTGTSDQ